MGLLFRNSTHTNGRSHDCLIANIKGKKVKVTYEAYNAVEKCTTEFFDGDKWNHILSMLDMGVKPENSAYNIWSEDIRKNEQMNYLNCQRSCASVLSNHLYLSCN